MSLSIQRDTPRCRKSVLNSNLRWDTNFTTFILRKSVFILGFWIFTFSILMVLVILLENDVFKLSVYLDIYIFFVCGHFALPTCWGISVKDSKFIEALILRCLLITCANKISQIVTLKLTADLMQTYQQHWHYQKCLIASLRFFLTC